MRIEFLSFYIQVLNNSDKCSENVIKQKIIIMKSSFNLLKELWFEIICAAVYLYNQTSCYFLNWKSSYKLFHICLTHQDDVVIKKWKSQQAYLKVYNCKTYYMTTKTLKKINCFDQLKFKTWIDFLVSYDSTNIYWIWNSVFNRMI